MIWTTTVVDLRAAIAARRASGPVGFVPTMGALHRGHAALLAAARRECAVVVASIFVNPTQFEDPGDLAAYPRVTDRDREVMQAAAVDVVFAPPVDEVYPVGHATSVVVGGHAIGYEGDYRPGHFDGVATVCLKLFSMVQPDAAYFGQKDAQQIAVIRQMTTDLNLPVRIRVVPTVRDGDGLALSSRNVRLSAIDRQRALALPRALRRGLEAHAGGGDPVEAARRELSGVDVDYVEVAAFSGDSTLVVAIRVGGTRLIDNVPLTDPGRAGLPR